MNLNRQLIEAASWRIVSEFLRRHPKRFRLIETHPGGGQYDCLSLYTLDNLRHVASFNRAGRLHVFWRPCGDGREVEPFDVWEAMAEAWDPKSLLDQVCERIGVPVPAKLPSSTPEVVVYRVIAAFLTHSVFGVTEWECRNGFLDSSGMEGGVWKDFQYFPGAQARLAVRLGDDILKQPAYRFWFLRKGNEPMACLEKTGTAWTRDGRTFDLPALYKQHKRIWPVVFEVLGDQLP